MARAKADTTDATDTGEREHSDADARTETYTATLRVDLTPEEVADRADRAAQHLADRDAKEEEQKAAAKHAKSVIEAIDAEMRRLSQEVRTRSTYRAVECQRVYDYEAGRVREVRLDTGEVLSDRAMTGSERQREIQFEENGETAP